MSNDALSAFLKTRHDCNKSFKNNTRSLAIGMHLRLSKYRSLVIILHVESLFSPAISVSELVWRSV